MKKLVIILNILLGIGSINAGFPSETLVNTPKGLLALQFLKVGDKVICQKPSGELSIKAIESKQTRNIDNLVAITTYDGIVMRASPDARFFMPKNQQWLLANALCQGNWLMQQNGECIKIKSVTKLPGLTVEVVDIGVAKYHNLGITENGIVVHNMSTDAAKKILEFAQKYGIISGLPIGISVEEIQKLAQGTLQKTLDRAIEKEDNPILENLMHMHRNGEIQLPFALNFKFRGTENTNSLPQQTSPGDQRSYDDIKPKPDSFNNNINQTGKPQSWTEWLGQKVFGSEPSVAQQQQQNYDELYRVDPKRAKEYLVSTAKANSSVEDNNLVDEWIQRLKGMGQPADDPLLRDPQTGLLQRKLNNYQFEELMSWRRNAEEMMQMQKQALQNSHSINTMPSTTPQLDTNINNKVIAPTPNLTDKAKTRTNVLMGHLDTFAKDKESVVSPKISEQLSKAKMPNLNPIPGIINNSILSSVVQPTASAIMSDVLKEKTINTATNVIKEKIGDRIKDSMNDKIKEVVTDTLQDVTKKAIQNQVNGAIKNAVGNTAKEQLENIVIDAAKDAIKEQIKEKGKEQAQKKLAEQAGSSLLGKISNIGFGNLALGALNGAIQVYNIYGQIKFAWDMANLASTIWNSGSVPISVAQQSGALLGQTATEIAKQPYIPDQPKTPTNSTQNGDPQGPCKCGHLCGISCHNCGCFCGCGQQNTDKDKISIENQNTEYKNGKYKDAEYHHSNSTGQGKGGKSPAPKNGQKALDNSIQIKDTAPSRIGVSEGQIVVLRQTLPGEFHGHIISLEELTSDFHGLFKKMCEAGLIDSKGNVLK